LKTKPKPKDLKQIIEEQTRIDFFESPKNESNNIMFQRSYLKLVEMQDKLKKS